MDKKMPESAVLVHFQDLFRGEELRESASRRVSKEQEEILMPLRSAGQRDTRVTTEPLQDVLQTSIKLSKKSTSRSFLNGSGLPTLNGGKQKIKFAKDRLHCVSFDDDLFEECGLIQAECAPSSRCRTRKA